MSDSIETTDRTEIEKGYFRQMIGDLAQKNEELTAENEQLKRDVMEWKTAQRECIDALGETEDRETALTAENQRLKNLLAEWVAPMDGMDADEFVANVAARIKETRQALETEAVKP